jgi:hypothetical protein
MRPVLPWVACLCLLGGCGDSSATSGAVAAPRPEDAAKTAGDVAVPPTITQLADVASAFDIAIVTSQPELPVKTHYGLIGGKEASGRALSRYVPIFIQEFTLYPPSLVRRARVKRVVLCEGLSFAGEQRGAIPDFEHDTLYLDVARGSYSEDYMRRVLHHEFFHHVDLRDDGSLYRDDVWAALNDPASHYGNGGRSGQGTPGASLLTDRFPGFLDFYATTGVEEDKAEVFACLLSQPGYVAHRIETDEILRAKVARMKALITSFAPEADADFWQRVGARRR